LNKTVNYAIRGNISSPGTPLAFNFPLIVPDKLLFRLRNIEFKLEGLQTSDMDVHAGVTQLSRDPARQSSVLLIAFQHFLASADWVEEGTGTAGLTAVGANHRVELWDYDYRLALAPTFHLNTVSLAQSMTAIIAGEFVGASEGERNAAIIWQGGAKDA